MKFNIEDYKGKYVMHCKTEEEARDFLTYLNSIGKRWCSGTSYLDNTSYDVYGSQTAYYFNRDEFSNVLWYKKNNYTILEWSDFMNKEFTKADLKTGDVVMRRNGKIGIINRELDTIISKEGYSDLNTMSSNLTTIDEQWDIIAVRRPLKQCDCQFSAFACEWGALVYERKEVEEMTLAEVCKLLGKEIKIVK